MSKTVETTSLEETGGARARIIAVIIVVLAFVGLFVASLSMHQSTADKAWRLEMTTGSTDAKRLYVMYTDLMCPYCDVFSREVMSHWDEFQTILSQNSILFEVRLTDSLYYGVGSEMSKASAEAAYCAVRENRFWDFYHGALAALWDDYHSKGIGVNKTAIPITNMPDDYWLKVGQKAGLSASFTDCVENHETAEEVAETTMKALKVSDGMPTFQFGKFSTSGFSDTWDWEYVKMYLSAGLEN